MLDFDSRVEDLFRLLDRLGPIPDEDLKVHFTGDNIESLRVLAHLLREGMDLERVLSEKRFVGVIRDLFQTKRIWSGKLNETLERASREFDQGNRIQALWIINGFVRFCPSPYFRKVAEDIMEEYEEADQVS